MKKILLTLTLSCFFLSGCLIEEEQPVLPYYKISSIQVDALDFGGQSPVKTQGSVKTEVFVLGINFYLISPSGRILYDPAKHDTNYHSISLLCRKAGSEDWLQADKYHLTRAIPGYEFAFVPEKFPRGTYDFMVVVATGESEFTDVIKIELI